MNEGILQVFTTAPWILLFLGLYMAATILIGIFYSKKVHEPDDLAVAGRKLGFFYLVPSILTTWICAGALMGAAGQAFLFGMQGIIFDPWAPALGMVLIGLFFAYRMRRAKYTTVTDFFNHRYGRFSGFLYTIIQILATLAWMGGQLVALGIIVHMTTGFDQEIAVLIAAVAIVIVTGLGGLWALSRVDAIGLAMILGGLVFLLPTALGTAGGPAGLLQGAANWAELPPWSMRIEGGEVGYLWYSGILGILLYISAWASLSLGDVPSQVLMQRALAAKNEKTAAAGFLCSGLLYLVLGMIPVLIGISIFSAGLLEGIPAAQAENILPWAAYSLMPPWAGVLLIVALAAAIVSTAGNSALVVSTLAGHNIYRYLRPQATSSQVLLVIRLCIPAAMITAAVVALYFDTVYRLIVLSGSIQLATISAAYIIGYFWKKANTAGAISSYFAGILTWLIAYRLTLPQTMAANLEMMEESVNIFLQWSTEDALFISLVPAAAVSVLTLVAVSLATQKKWPPRPMRSLDGADMSEVPRFFWSKKA